ncbi:uncharacterized protein [Rutidosis leptorrhynchoides]|uniref:uncharacterized protein n=1 Tax=Rutidosis leptorrhynchoides TaxID=125765 RepID=UPI003A99B510
MKVYRALKGATSILQGDYKKQYTQLRDYTLELMRCDKDTTVRIQCEYGDPNAPTRVIKRIYICLGPLKKGFAALGRDQECYSSWKWFLEWLGQDLKIERNSNFTFISDRQKGLAKAVGRLYPCAEQRFSYKNHLWRCATSTTVPEFKIAMNQLKEFNKDCHKWLTDISPHQWARSHFSGRAVSDNVLSNMCEIFNRWLLDARDKPIITALEYIRENFEKIKEEASKCSILWNGGQQYQVSGLHGDQCVVDMGLRECACRKWELTGMPCKYAVACLNNMAFNNGQVGVPEEWVHQVHWLKRWQETYAFHIQPLNGKALWPKSNELTKKLPPLKIATAGRPKKNRRKSA